MRILFDQGTPVGIKDFLQGLTVKTAYQQGWSTLLNGELLKAAENAGFDLFLTTDKNLSFQQNPTGRKIEIVVLNRSKWSLIQAVPTKIAEAVNASRPGTYSLVDIPDPN